MALKLSEDGTWPPLSKPPAGLGPDKQDAGEYVRFFDMERYPRPTDVFAACPLPESGFERQIVTETVLSDPGPWWQPRTWLRTRPVWEVRYLRAGVDERAVRWEKTPWTWGEILGR